MPLLKKKNKETEKVLYSEPWMFADQGYESYREDWTKDEKYKNAYFQALNWFWKDDIIIAEKKNFKYFLLGSKEEAESIKVNGHKPDEIIEHDVVDQELNKHKSYFVYFNDIEMSGRFDDMEITFE